MFNSIAQFTNIYKNECESTYKLLNLLTDESLSQKVWAEGRDLGYLSWHIVVTLGEMMGSAGLSLDTPDQKSEAPKSAKVIADTYKKLSSELLEKISVEWNDEKLNEEIDMYGEKWTRGFTLYVLINHEIHHRGQMTVLMRQAGLKVLGVYGPAKEEWAAYNAPAIP